MAAPAGGQLSAAMRATYEEAGVSQVDVAAALNVDQPTVSRWARGTRVPPLNALRVIERLCHVPLGTILTRAGYVEEPSRGDVERAIRSDPKLTDRGRTTLLHLYQVLTAETTDTLSPNRKDEDEMRLWAMDTYPEDVRRALIAKLRQMRADNAAAISNAAG